MKTCNHCPGELERHDGLLHCPQCGCWFVGRGGELDPNHTACSAAQREEIPVDGQNYAPAAEFVNQDVTPIDIAVSKGGKPSPEGDEVPAEDSRTPERVTRRSK